MQPLRVSRETSYVGPAVLVFHVKQPVAERTTAFCRVNADANSGLLPHVSRGTTSRLVDRPPPLFHVKRRNLSLFSPFQGLFLVSGTFR